MSQTVVSYLRVSTHKQGVSGLGLEAQREYVRNYCARNEAKLGREFVEVESGRKNDRVILAQAIRYAKRTKSVLVIAKLDRLARNVAFVANLMETRVKFEACDMAGANDMTIHVMAAVAQQEAAAIASRTRDAQAVAKANGVLFGSHRPNAKPLSAEARLAGQVRSAIVNRAKAVAEYADVAPMIFKLADRGLSMRAIAAKLNDDGHVTRTGSEWTATQVHRVLARVNAA